MENVVKIYNGGMEETDLVTEHPILFLYLGKVTQKCWFWRLKILLW